MKEDIAKLILRVTVGGLLLFHGIDKAQHGVTFIEGLLNSHNLPPIVTYGVYIGEIVAPILLIVGLVTWFAALIVIVNMVMAIALVYGDTLFTLNEHGGWSIEMPMFYLLTSLAIMLFGAGKYSLDYYLYEKES